MLLFVLDRRPNRTDLSSEEVEMLSFTAWAACPRACVLPDLRSSRKSVADAEEEDRLR